MSGYTDLRDLAAGAHKNMADLLAETVTVYAYDGSTAVATGVSAVVRDPTNQERRWMGAYGITVDRVVEVPKQGAFSPLLFEPHRFKILHSGTLYEIVQANEPLAATDSGAVKPASVVLFCQRMGIGLGELPVA